MAEPDWGPGLRCTACQKAIEARSLLGPSQILVDAGGNPKLVDFTLLLRRDGTSAGARANLRFHSKESSKGAFKPLLHVLVEEPATAVAP